MSESDLMNKFDAFIKKHHAAMVDEIPVLTDIVSEEEYPKKAEIESSFEQDSSIAAVNENDETAILTTEEFITSAAKVDSLIQSGEDFPFIQSSDIQEEQFPVLVDVYEEPEIKF